MMQEYKQDEKQLWWVRYVTKRDLESGVPLQGDAFFYATNEEELNKLIAGWLRYIQHDGVTVQEITPVPPDFKLHFYNLLQELPEHHQIIEFQSRQTGEMTGATGH
jgi:hypothetical protein